MSLQRRALLWYLAAGVPGAGAELDRVRSRRRSNRAPGPRSAARDEIRQPGFRWQRYYPVVQDFVVADRLPDESYVLGGYTSQGNPVVVAVTADGDERWRWIREIDGTRTVNAIQPADDGNVVAGGVRQSDDSSEAVVQWFDGSGTVVRTATFGRGEARDNSGFYPLQVGRFDDGSYVLVYHRNGGDDLVVHPVVVGFDDRGEERWRVGFDRGEAMYVHRLIPGPDGTVRLVGSVRGLNYEGWLATVAPGGEFDFGRLAAPTRAATADGDAVVVATHRSDEDGEPLRVRKVNGEGSVTWRRRHDVGGSNGTVADIAAVPGGGYVLVIVDPWARGSCPGTLLVRLTGKGDLSWHHCYAGGDALLDSWVVLAPERREFVLAGDRNGGWVGSFFGDDELAIVPTPDPPQSPTSSETFSPPATATGAGRGASPTGTVSPSPLPNRTGRNTPGTPSTPPSAVESTPGFGVLAGLVGVGGALLARFRARTE